MVALPTIWSVPLVLEFADLLWDAIVAAMTSVLLRLLPLLRQILVAEPPMPEHSKWHTNLAFELMLTLTLLTLTLLVLEVNRRHSMADSLLANDPARLYGSVAVNIVASNRLNRSAASSDHLANYCSSVGVVFGYAVAVAEAVVVADIVSQRASDRAAYFDSVFVDFDTTSEEITTTKKDERRKKSMKQIASVTIEQETEQKKLNG